SVVLGLPCSSLPLVLFFLDTTATPATCTLSLHDALPIFDDTLYLERDYVRSGFHAVGEHLRRTHGVDGFSRRAWELFESGHRGSTFDVVLAELGLPEALVPGLVRVYREHEPDIELLPDAREALGTLSRYVHLAVISDGPEQSQREKAKALGLERWCDPIVLTARYGREFGKP